MRHTESQEGRSVRLLRVGEQVRHALSDILMRGDVHDDVLASHSVSVTEVRMSPDLRHATVFVKPLLGADEAEVIAALKKNVRYLRGEVSRRVNTKYAAMLKFVPDESFEEGTHIEKLLRSPKVAADLGDGEKGVSLHGWLVIDKPVGPGSTQIVSAVKRALREGGYPKTKVGHGGTLDPLASGVLPVALGEATKLCGRMLDSDKAYEFTLAFGTETSTLDAEGEVVARSNIRPRPEEIEAVLPRFTGQIEQVPPAYSALMIEGRRAYDRARAGENVEMKHRGVMVHALELLELVGERATFAARVSKGTYIRALARDIAQALGTVGHVALLRRTKAGAFTLDRAISLDKVGELGHSRQLEQALLPLTAGLDDIPALPVTPDQARLLRQGRKLAGIAAKPGLHLATDGPVPVALVELEGPELRVVRGFNL